MTFNGTIEKTMSEVQSGSQEPFIIFRDNSGEWQFAFTQNQYGETFDWVEDVKKADPFALTFTGEDFSHGSFPYVYDRVLSERFRAEYETAPFAETNPDELRALVNFLEENIGEFSSEVTDYLSMFDRPLAALYEMTPIRLASDNPDFDYDNSKTQEFINAVEHQVNDRLNNRKKQEIPKEVEQSQKGEKSDYDGYKELNKIQINSRLVVLAENPEAENRYMVCEYRWDNPFGVMDNKYTGVTHDYVEALQEFTKILQHNVNCVISTRDVRKELLGVEPTPLDVSDCIPNGLQENLEGKLIVIKAEVLSPEFQTADHQLKICQGGFGANPNARGNAVFCKDLYSGKESRFERSDVLGVADIARLPQWAKTKLAELEKSAEPPQKEVAKPSKKPTLQEKLENAKEKVKEADAKKDAQGDKPKKRNGLEVE